MADQKKQIIGNRKIQILASIKAESKYTGEPMSWEPGDIEEACLIDYGYPLGIRAEVDWG